MYTKIKNVQIIISIMKQYNIRHIVLSAGTRHVPIAHSVENDDFFKCYSVVDERSAAYFALGLIKQLNQPVAIACTSSTATCNYTPAVAEAYYQGLPLLILTGDRFAYNLNQLEDQMINQVDMYKNFCKKCVNLPIVNTKDDEWYCDRLVNEAVIELTRNENGPVQINFQINQSIDDIADASEKVLPKYRKIELMTVRDMRKWDFAQKKLEEARRILVICGSSKPIDKDTKNAMKRFFERYNCVFITEALSNVCFEGAVNAYRVAEAIDVHYIKSIIRPDIVIFYGGNYVSRWKVLLKNCQETFESWCINDSGEIVDVFRNLTQVFESDIFYFFDWFARHSNKKNDRQIFNTVKSLYKKVLVHEYPTIVYRVNETIEKDAKYKGIKIGENDLLERNQLTAFAAMHELSKIMPSSSLLHLSILNSTRIMQLFDLPQDTETYSNIGTDGIDGSMSTFLGQATSTEKECYLVIGDLSFFYDMNSLMIRNIGKNVHIMLINNGGGSEFYLSMGPKKLPNIDLHISAAHQNSAKNWVDSCGLRYCSASTYDELIQILPKFVSIDGPVVLEVFTNKEKDVMVYKGFRRLIHIEDRIEEIKKNKIVNSILNSSFGESVKKIKRVIVS